MILKDQKCVSCEGGTLPMKEEEIKKHLSQVGGWSAEENTIVKLFEFKNFLFAIDFVNNVAKIAEDEGHHPDINIFSYKKVRITLSTHSIGGLSLNDFIVAAKIDTI